MCRGLAFDEHAYREAGSRSSPHTLHIRPPPPASHIRPHWLFNRYISGQATTGRPDRRIRYGCKFAAGGPAAPADPHAAARA